MTVGKDDMVRQDYVLGFAFDPERRKVGVIRKNRPIWQAGKLNGIGGHIETTDASPHAAMVREFQEETGLIVPRWAHFATMHDYYRKWRVRVYRAFDVPLYDMQTMTDEEVGIIEVGLHSGDTLPNLSWLIPLALCGEPTFASVEYYNEEEKDS